MKGESGGADGAIGAAAATALAPHPTVATVSGRARQGTALLADDVFGPLMRRRGRRELEHFSGVTVPPERAGAAGAAMAK